MSKFDVKPGRAMRIWAAFIAITALAQLIFTDLVSRRVIGAAMLLTAWEMAFVPNLPLNLTFGQIYQKARQGWRMSRTARIVNYVTFALIILGTYLGFQGR